ncbi:GNAT family N-acetyltransferase [Octadecabacter sp.]|nr:GNAT family N-acetyltransferase [Octadecabacter sp.]
MTETKYSFRLLAPDDAAQWRALRLRSIRDFPLGFLVTEEEASQVTIEQLVDRLKLGNDWGVFVGETLVGFCNCRRQNLSRTKHRGEIGPFFIDAVHHGTQAASLLMETIIADARSKGIEQLELYVDSKNHRAIRFYERMGFSHAATLPNAVKIDGHSHDDHFYIQRLKT